MRIHIIWSGRHLLWLIRFLGIIGIRMDFPDTDPTVSFFSKKLTKSWIWSEIFHFGSLLNNIPKVLFCPCPDKNIKIRLHSDRQPCWVLWFMFVMDFQMSATSEWPENLKLQGFGNKILAVLLDFEFIDTSTHVLWSRSQSRLEPDFFAGAGAGEKAPAPGCCCMA